MSTLNTILHPTDFSESSNRAFVWACSLAKENKASLILLHVMLPAVAPFSHVSTSAGTPPAESHEEHERSFPWPEPTHPEIVVEHRIEEGDTAAAILRFAESSNCDVIVMGTHGRTGFRRMLTGSVAEEVLRKSACPVLIVKDLPHESRTASQKPAAKPGDVIDVLTSDATSTLAHEHTLVKGDDLEVVRLTIPIEAEIQKRRSISELIVHCVSGRVELTSMGKTQQLTAGRIVFLSKGQAYSIKGIEASNVILTELRSKS